MDLSKYVGNVDEFCPQCHSDIAHTDESGAIFKELTQWFEGIRLGSLEVHTSCPIRNELVENKTVNTRVKINFFVADEFK